MHTVKYKDTFFFKVVQHQHNTHEKNSRAKKRREEKYKFPPSGLFSTTFNGYSKVTTLLVQRRERREEKKEARDPKIPEAVPRETSRLEKEEEMGKRKNKPNGFSFRSVQTRPTCCYLCLLRKKLLYRVERLRFCIVPAGVSF